MCWAIKMAQPVKVQAAKNQHVSKRQTNKNQDSVSFFLPGHGRMSFPVMSPSSPEQKLPSLTSVETFPTRALGCCAQSPCFPVETQRAVGTPLGSLSKEG